MGMKVSTSEQIKAAKFKINEIKWKTRFNFPREHNGWRPGMIHTFLSNAGGGKSTLAKTIILDAAEMNPDKNILVWLSEEYKEVWEGHFFNELDPTKFPNLRIFSEKNFLEDGPKDREALTRAILRVIKTDEINLLVYDNITTSKFYKGLEAQGDMVNAIIYSFPKDIPKIIFAHTNATYKKYGKDIMDSSHMYGAKDLEKVSEVFYCLIQIQSKDMRLSFLKSEKNRLHTQKNDFYFMDYCPSEKRYRMDSPRDFESFKSLFAERNKL